MGWAVERAFTGKINFDGLIREGFDRQTRLNKTRALRKQRHESGLKQFHALGLVAGKGR